MDADRFDALLRSLSEPRSRRAAAGLTLTGLAGSLLGLTDIDAKRKKKKKKKKCKGGAKKCGKKCISADDCCTSADCATGGACAGGLCICPDGQKNCYGECVNEDLCCLQCEENCCQADEVCHGEPGGDPICQTGGCPETDYCNDPEVFYCATEPLTCVCATTIDSPSVKACVVLDGLNPDSCDACSASSQCGPDEVCVPGDTSESGFCGCTSSFCVPRCGEF